MTAPSCHPTSSPPSPPVGSATRPATATSPNRTLLMTAPRYLTQPEIARIHDIFLHLTGAPPAALRDPGLLASAISRPRAAAHYEGADLVRQAALLAVGISQAQAFVDGN